MRMVLDRCSAVAADCIIGSRVVADSRRGENNWTNGRAETNVAFSMHLLASARRNATR